MRVIVVEDNVLFCNYICNFLQKADLDTVRTYRLAQAKKIIGTSVREDDIVLADLRLPDGESTTLLQWMRENGYMHPFIMMTNYEEIHSAVHTMKLGAEDYILKPLVETRLLPVIKKIRTVNEAFTKVIYERKSTPFCELNRYIHMVAPTDMTVLILGSTGTGKEHLAKKIHRQSLRSGKPYVTVDCGAIPEELAASEFFGHRKGSFTGADSDKPGLFQEADGGTLFLDEIGNLSYKTQMLLLRALQEKCYKQVGSTKERRFDIRLLAATNENLEKAITEGRFREDLFHRLNEFTIRVPLLSECPEDILPMAKFFLERFSKEHRVSLQGFDSLAIAAIREYGWPGNIRELRNTVRSAMLLATNGWITAGNLKLDLSVRPEENVILSEDEKERQLLVKMLEQTGNNRSRTARLLNMSRTTLYEKLKRYGII